MKELSQDHQREYQTVILAALFHDIGKFLHRGDIEYEGSHQKASSDFIKKFYNRLKNDNLYDIDLIRLLIQHHHSSKKDTLEDDYFKNKSTEEKAFIWKLISIVKRADSYSCPERDQDQSRKKGVGRERVALDSVFSNINLERKIPEKEELNRYHIMALCPLSCFPAPIEKIPEKGMSDLINSFEKNIPEFSRYRSYDALLNQWIDLLEKFTWAVPSDTRYDISDVSLYDHLRSTAAIAACLFKRHILAIMELKNLTKINEFILIGGDFSGLEWENLPKLINFFLFLDDKINDNNSNINPAFIYRLLGYHRMALDYLKSNNIVALKYISHLSYDISRNIIKFDKIQKNRIVGGQEEYSFLQTLLNKSPEKNPILCNLKIPIFWCLYKNRKSSINEYPYNI